MYYKKFFGTAMALMLTAVLASCNIGKASVPTPDVNALYTAAAGTMLAQLGDQQTQTAAVVSPTPFSSPTALDTFTPLATFPIGVTPFGTPIGTPFTFGTPGALTPVATSASAGGFAVGCNNAVWVAETVPDKTVFKKGKRFSKAWELLNTGTCQWDQGYGFYFKSGEQLNGQNVVIPGNCGGAGTPGSLCVSSSSKEITRSGHSQTFVIKMQAPLQDGEYIGYWQMKSDAGTWFGSLVSVDIIVKGQ